MNKQHNKGKKVHNTRKKLKIESGCKCISRSNVYKKQQDNRVTAPMASLKRPVGLRGGSNTGLGIQFYGICSTTKKGSSPT